MTGADHRHAQLLPERDPSGGGAGTASAGLRLPSSSFEGYLIDQIESGFFTAKQAKDVLAARERLGARLNDIPPDFSGYAAATVDGQLYTTTDLSIAAVLEWLDHHNPPGRFGYFTWVQAAKP